MRPVRPSLLLLLVPLMALVAPTGCYKRVELARKARPAQTRIALHFDVDPSLVVMMRKQAEFHASKSTTNAKGQAQAPADDGVEQTEGAHPVKSFRRHMLQKPAQKFERRQCHCLALLVATIAV